jgi:motility quorum-sensing regulator / GCU-specific mRNA interferase toxin
MDKVTPHYSLQDIIEQMDCVDAMNLRFTTLDDLRALKIKPATALSLVRSLTTAEFYKSMESNINPGTWQDVYRPTYNGVTIYLKFGKVLDSDEFLVVSCKEK